VKRIILLAIVVISLLVPNGRVSAQDVPTVRIIYLVTNGGSDYHREKQIARTVQTANDWLSTQIDGNRLRIDPTVERVTIPETDQDMRESGPYWVIKAALIDRFKDRNVVLVVFVDFFLGNGVCGEADRRLAVIYPSNCAGHNDVFRQMLFLHETFHAIGIVPYCAPNHDRRRVGHVDDSPKDIMYKHIQENYMTIDVGRDDYYLNPDPECPGLLSSPFITRPQ